MRRRLAVLMGGRSSEHEVSLSSAQAVLAALDPERYEVIPVLISREGGWSVDGAPVALVPAADGAPVLASLDGGPDRPLDAVFPVLHGPNGEDGTVQGALETAGVAYVAPVPDRFGRILLVCVEPTEHSPRGMELAGIALRTIRETIAGSAEASAEALGAAFAAANAAIMAENRPLATGRR